MSTETQPSKSLVPFGKQGVTLSSMEDAFRFAVAVSKSGFAPKGIETPEAILIAVQFGAELGLTPMSSLQSLAIINGRPAVYGDAALALVRGSGLLETYQQSTTGEGDNMKAIVRVKRKDESEIVSEFSVADAKKAQLWGKSGPWTQYPARMLMWRARGFALRDGFGDVLRGLRTVEEVEDLPSIKDVTPAPRAKVPRESKALPESSSTTVASGDESPKASEAVETPIVEDTAQTSDAPLTKLEKLIADAGLKFEDIKPIIKPNRLCGSDAKSVEDLTEDNIIKVIADFDIISSAAKAEKGTS